MNKLEITSLPTCWAGLYTHFSNLLSCLIQVFSLRQRLGVWLSLLRAAQHGAQAPAPAPALCRPAPVACWQKQFSLFVCASVIFILQGLWLPNAMDISETQRALKIERFFFDSCGGKNDLKWCESSSVFPLEIQRCLLMECFPKPIYYAVHVQYYLCKALKSEPQTASRALD